MTRILWMATAIALSLAEVAAVLYASSDEKVLFAPALPYLSEDSRMSTSTEELKKWISAVEQQNGKIRDVKGEKSSMGSDTAEAKVLIQTPGGRTELRFHLLREHALWKIAQLPEGAR